MDDENLYSDSEALQEDILSDQEASETVSEDLDDLEAVQDDDIEEDTVAVIRIKTESDSETESDLISDDVVSGDTSDSEPVVYDINLPDYSQQLDAIQGAVTGLDAGLNVLHTDNETVQESVDQLHEDLLQVHEDIQLIHYDLVICIFIALFAWMYERIKAGLRNLLKFTR